jgi:hypothetical protein
MFLLLVGAVIWRTITSLDLFHIRSLSSRNCWSCKHALSCAISSYYGSFRNKQKNYVKMLLWICSLRFRYFLVPFYMLLNFSCHMHSIPYNQKVLIKHGHWFRSVICNPFLINKLPDGLSTGMNFRWDFYSDVQHDIVITDSNIILLELFRGN